MTKILVIENDPKYLELLNVNLKDLGFSISFAENGKNGIDLLEKIYPDIVICDLELPDYDGFYILDKVKKYDPKIQIILISEHYSVDSTIKATQFGAFDYLQKPLDFSKLLLKISRAIEIHSVSQRLGEYINNELEEFTLGKSLISKTYSTQKLISQIEELANSKVSVLIEGESGTGKEEIAKIIHFSGITKEKPFITLNCSAFSPDSLENELFGESIIKANGQIQSKKGRFELAQDGTLFLDEISDLSDDLQDKLLNVIKNREFKKIGGEIYFPMNARIIVTCNKNLDDLVSIGEFNNELYDKLKVFTLSVPPLRERKNDMPLLVANFLNKINDKLHKNVNNIPIDVIDKLTKYNWPGNLKELENVLFQAVFLSNSNTITCENINLEFNKNIQNCDESKLSLEEVEKRHILNVLKKNNWNKNRAVKVLGISKPTLYSKVEKYKLKNNLK